MNDRTKKNTALPCEVVCDLLPVYIDGLCGEETSQLVREHLEECEECRKEHTAMSEDMLRTKASAESKKGGALKKTLKKIKKHTVKMVCIYLAAALAAGGVLYTLMEIPLRTVHYSELELTVSHQTVTKENLRENESGFYTGTDTYGDEHPLKILNVSINGRDFKFEILSEKAEPIINREMLFLVYNSEKKCIQIDSRYDRERKAVLFHFKTTFWDNKEDDYFEPMVNYIPLDEENIWNCEATDGIDMLIYEDGGEEHILWQRE